MEIAGGKAVPVILIIAGGIVYHLAQKSTPARVDPFLSLFVPIWLFRPETDLDAYSRSIRRLAALAPQIRLVLGAHNVPVAKPEVLPKLVQAFDAVRSGHVQPAKADSGRAMYTSGDFKFLMRAPEEKH